ncbi:MAG: hypothetical protein JWO44_2333 [Bacteroidetes bacterium]|nr:hypothetical protein [Bacteroidota bacterium]
MKKIIITLFLLPLFVACYSQNDKFEYAGRFSPSIKKEKLNEAKFISEIMPKFCERFALPYGERMQFDQLLKIIDSEWKYYASLDKDYIRVRENYEEVMHYVSIDISTICNGKVMTSQSADEKLTAAQKNILNAADPGTDIKIKIRFRYKRWTNDDAGGGSMVREGEYAVAVVPDTEAEYPGGFKQLTEYLTKSVIDKIPGKNPYGKIRQVIVKFSINEEGQVVDAKLSRNSSDPKTDKLLLDAINNMPKWKPAKNSKGVRVRQEFSIPFGGEGC